MVVGWLSQRNPSSVPQAASSSVCVARMERSDIRVLPGSTAIPDFVTLNPGYFAYRLVTSHASSWMASACFARRWRGRKKMLATKVGTMALPMTAATNAEYCD